MDNVTTLFPFSHPAPPTPDYLQMAFHYGFIILGAVGILTALFIIGFKERMRREGKAKKGKRWIYEKTSK